MLGTSVPISKVENQKLGMTKKCTKVSTVMSNRTKAEFKGHDSLTPLHHPSVRLMLKVGPNRTQGQDVTQEAKAVPHKEVWRQRRSRTVYST